MEEIYIKDGVEWSGAASGVVCRRAAGSVTYLPEYCGASGRGGPEEKTEQGVSERPLCTALLDWYYDLC